MLTPLLFILHFDSFAYGLALAHISIFALFRRLGFTGISQLNEFCMKKTLCFPKGCVMDQTVTQSPAFTANSPHSEQGHIVPYLYSQNDQKGKMIPSDT